MEAGTVETPGLGWLCDGVQAPVSGLWVPARLDLKVQLVSFQLCCIRANLAEELDQFGLARSAHVGEALQGLVITLDHNLGKPIALAGIQEGLILHVNHDTGPPLNRRLAGMPFCPKRLRSSNFMTANLTLLSAMGPDVKLQDGDVGVKTQNVNTSTWLEAAQRAP